jgi:oxalate decarboxylase/phosphoglucose isomerase-like protein (cupin superfamily)
MWTVDYEPGGFQDAHFHQPGNNLYTIIINLLGSGQLILFDPRQLATAHGESISKIETLSPGYWIALPSWLVHGTRPSLNRRSILVMDVNK